MAKQHRRFKTFKLDEISAVDRPAQQGAKAVIMKRDTSGSPDLYLAKADGAAALPPAVEEYLKREFSQDQRDTDAKGGAALPDGSFPISTRSDLENAIRAVGRAKDAEKAKTHIIARARALDATSLLPSDWKVGKAVGGDLVVEIARVAPRDLPAMLDEVIKAEEIEAQVAQITDAKMRGEMQQHIQVAKSALIASCWSALDTTSPEDMASVLRKNFTEYKDHVLGLVPGGVDTTNRDRKAGDYTMALKDIAKALGLAETATETEIVAAALKVAKGEVADLQAKLEKSDQLAKMSGKHKAFMENDKEKMPAGGKDAFAAMTPDARDAHMASNPVNTDVDKNDKTDETVTFKGQTISKRAVGDAQFAITKAMAEEIEKGETERAVGVIEKRVAPMKNIIAKAADVAGVLYRIAKGKSTQADADAIETVLTSANEVMSKNNVLMKEIGGNGGEGGFAKAIDAITAQAAELMKKDPKLTLAKARGTVRDQNPDLAKQEQDEAREARKAA